MAMPSTGIWKRVKIRNFISIEKKKEVLSSSLRRHPFQSHYFKNEEKQQISY
jgi:hypothetical protein